MKTKVVLVLLAVFLVLVGIFLGNKLTRKPPIETKFIEEVKIASPPAEPASRPAPAVPLNKPGEKTLLGPTRVSYQTFNNCGPATLSMILSYYKISKSQAELGQLMRPYQHPKGDNDDKTIFTQEFVAWTQNYGLESLHRPNGSLQLLKLFLANDIPVVVKQWLRPNEDIGHFRIVRGFDEEKQIIITDDSYFGPNRKHSYFDFLSMWQPFNYGYIPVYKKDQEPTLLAILGEDFDEKLAYRKALERAKKESQLDPENPYPVFNQSINLYHLEEYEESIAAFEAVESRLPRRMLWYQIEPILAYRQLGNRDKVFAISDYIFDHGNRAFSELYQIRGEIFLERGERGSARREFELALYYNRNYEPAKEALERLD